ncbi:MAG: serine/threonine-protein kinase [Vicinamibacterales bacterium]
MLRLRGVVAEPVFADDRYAVTSSIGSGGMGRVFEAQDRHLGRAVAIKVSHAPLAGDDLDARLRREAQVLASLEHPGIVPVHDVGLLADGRVFYVMKLVQGTTLTQAAASLGTDAARLAVFERVVEAVAFAHARGVVHRDLSPANVMVGRFGEVLVMDWGVARLMNSVASETPARVGTPGFTAPESAAGSGAAGPAVDVYALGALLQWLFAAKPRLPRRLRAIIAKCLSPEPSDRYTDARGLAADLARYRADQAVDALPENVFDWALRFGAAHLTFILLLAAYLVMRVVVAYIQAR